MRFKAQTSDYAALTGPTLTIPRIGSLNDTADAPPCGWRTLPSYSKNQIQKKPHGVAAMRFLNLKRSIYISFAIKPL